MITRYTHDPEVALRDTVTAIWRMVERATTEHIPDYSRSSPHALLARRELVQRGTSALSTVIRRGVESGTFWPRCSSWAIERLPFAIVAGACARWVFGLSRGPSLRAATAVAAALDVLRPPAHQRGASIHEQGAIDERGTGIGRYA